MADVVKQGKASSESYCWVGTDGLTKYTTEKPKPGVNTPKVSGSTKK